MLNPLATGLAIFALTLFLDVLELSFARSLFFIRTLRFWLYFVLHFGLSVIAAFLLRGQIAEWYVLAVVATFLGVAVLSNTNIKIAGYSLVPVADLFGEVRAKMLAQAAEEKAAEVTRAEVIERLQKLPVGRIEQVHRAGLAGVQWSDERIEQNVAKARTSIDYKSALIAQLVKANLPYVLKKLEAWEQTP